MENIENLDLLRPVSHTKRLDLVSGSGASMMTSDGKEYLDFNEICVVLGQNDRHFIDRMTKALGGVTSGKRGYSDDKLELYGYLDRTTGHAFKGIHLTSSGSETTEWAVKLAQKITGKSEVLSFWNSIHGRTHLSASMSGLPKRKTLYGPVCPGTVFAPYPDAGHAPFDENGRIGGMDYFDFLDKKIKYESADDIAAVIVEPYQGSGVIIPPHGWLRRLQDWAHARGALFIVDEIQSGMGRTGDLYRYTSEGLSPDMLLLGKGLGNGLHISALLTAILPEEKYLHALTGGAGDDALASAASCAVFEELLENGLLDHVKKVSALMAEKLEELRSGCSCVKAVRCAGLACAVELESTDCLKKALPAFKERGLLVSPSVNNSFMLKPPYTVTEEQIGKMAAILGDVLATLS